MKKQMVFLICLVLGNKEGEKADDLILVIFFVLGNKKGEKAFDILDLFCFGKQKQ